MLEFIGGLLLSWATAAFRWYSARYAGLLTAISDIKKAVIHNQVAEDDLVATHKTFQGTHKGEFMGVQPTGKKAALDIIDFSVLLKAE